MNKNNDRRPQTDSRAELDFGVSAVASFKPLPHNDQSGHAQRQKGYVRTWFRGCGQSATVNQASPARCQHIGGKIAARTRCKIINCQTGRAYIKAERTGIAWA